MASASKNPVYALTWNIKASNATLQSEPLGFLESLATREAGRFRSRATKGRRPQDSANKPSDSNRSQEADRVGRAKSPPRTEDWWPSSCNPIQVAHSSKESKSEYIKIQDASEGQPEQWDEQNLGGSCEFKGPREISRDSRGGIYASYERQSPSRSRAANDRASWVCSSVCLPSARTSASLIERLARGRANSRRLWDRDSHTRLQLKSDTFSSPKIVKPQAKCMLKVKDEERRHAKAKSLLSRNQEASTSCQPSKAVRQPGSSKGEEPSGLPRSSQFRRAIGADLLLDNFRKKSRSPTPDLGNSEGLDRVTRSHNLLARHYFALATHKQPSVRTLSPVKIIARLSTADMRHAAHQQLLARSSSYYEGGYDSGLPSTRISQQLTTPR